MRSILKNIYSIIAVVAIVHLFGLLGLGAYLCTSGTVTADRVDAIAGILRGESPPEAEPVMEKPEPESPTEPSEKSIAEGLLHDEVMRREAQRRLAELHQRQVAVSLLMQKITEDSERLEEERATFDSQVQAATQQDRDDALAKTIELLESSPPEVAKDLLLQLESDDAAARLLERMDTRQGTKILEAAMEDPSLRPRALQVFKRVQELAQEGSDWALARPMGAES